MRKIVSRFGVSHLILMIFTVRSYIAKVFLGVCWIFLFGHCLHSACGFSATNTSPANGGLNIPLTNSVLIQLDENVDTSTVNSNTFKVRGSQFGEYQGSFSFPATNEILFMPSVPYLYGEQIEVSLSSNIQSTTAVALDALVFSFICRSLGTGTVRFFESDQELTLDELG